MTKSKSIYLFKFFILSLLPSIILIKVNTLYAGTQGIRYYFKEKSFSIEIPKDWRIRQPSESEIDFILSKNKESYGAYGVSVIMNIIPFSEGMDLKNYLEEFLARTKPNLSAAGYKKPEDFNIDKTAAKCVYFTYGNNRFLTGVVIKDKYVYILDCFTIIKQFNKYNPVFEEIIKSIEFM